VINIAGGNTVFTVEDVSGLLANGSAYCKVSAITITKVNSTAIKIAFTLTGTGASLMTTSILYYRITDWVKNTPTE
jgi:hypothetical protein